MEGLRRTVRLAVGAALLLAFALVAVMLPRGGDPAPVPLQARDGSPLAMPSAAGVTEARWQEAPVLLFTVPAKRLAAVEALRGAGEATAALPVPGHPELRMFALSAKSTYLGCTVTFLPTLGASLDIPDYDLDGLADGRVLDPCHHGQWDPYHKGAPVAGPAPERLAALDLRIQRGQLAASAFDGPVG